MLDCIIIGSGPAGLSAALNLKTYHKDFLWFGSKNLSEKMRKAELVDNYPGFPMIKGIDLAKAFEEHAKASSLEITEKTVTNISEASEGYFVLADNEIYETRTIILATGVEVLKPLENEETFLGRGVSYCATCDGNFFKGKKIAVISNDPKYEHEVEFLSSLALEVYYFPTFESSLVKDNLVIRKEVPFRIDGEKKVESLSLRNGETINLDGVFCLRNCIAPSKLFPSLEVADGHIVVNRMMETNRKGVFAAGDCTGRPYQFTKAAGEGNIAAHGVIARLAEKRN